MLMAVADRKPTSKSCRAAPGISPRLKRPRRPPAGAVSFPLIGVLGSREQAARLPATADKRARLRGAALKRACGSLLDGFVNVGNARFRSVHDFRDNVIRHVD